MLVARKYITAGGDTTLVSAVSGYKVVVTYMRLINSSAVDVYFKSGTSAISDTTIPLADNSGDKLDHNLQGYFECSANEDLKINTSGTTKLHVVVGYRLETA
jgi:hypothetical protein